MAELIYHLYPRAGAALDLNLVLLGTYVDIFDRIRIGVALDKTTVSPTQLRRFIPSRSEIVYFNNDPVLGETVTFRHFLPTIENHGFTFYGHSKGVSQKLNGQLRQWITACYACNLDRVPQGTSCSGCFRLNETHFGYGPTTYNWHYSGTFFWFNNAQLRARPGWRDLQGRNRFTVETYLSWHFPKEQAECRCGLQMGSFYGRPGDFAIEDALKDYPSIIALAQDANHAGGTPGDAGDARADLVKGNTGRFRSFRGSAHIA